MSDTTPRLPADQTRMINEGAQVVTRLHSDCGDDPAKLCAHLEKMVADGQARELAAGLFVATLTHSHPSVSHSGTGARRRSSGGSTALGVAAGLSGGSSGLYHAARVSRDISALASGDPSRIMRRGRNKMIGRAIGRSKLWR